MVLSISILLLLHFIAITMVPYSAAQNYGLIAQFIQYYATESCSSDEPVVLQAQDTRQLLLTPGDAID